MLEAIRDGGAKPTSTTYQLHLQSAAVYDAFAAFDDDAYGYYSEITIDPGLITEAVKAEAVSFASYRMLATLFPEHTATFDAFMNTLGYDTEDTATGTGSGAAIGNLAAANVLAARVGDGSNAENGFADTTGYTPVNSPDPDAANAPGGADFDPNSWQPLRVPNGTLVNDEGIPIFDNDDPSTYTDQVALAPHWGSVDSFALGSDMSVFRPPAPPKLGDFSEYVDGRGNVTTGDQAYRDQFTEVVDYSANLDNRGKVIAEFWADGPRTESPPGHWNQIAQDIALREGHGIDEDAKMFFALNTAVFDAGIATWEAKYYYNFIRPQSAIRDLYFDQEIEAWGGPEHGTETILGQFWQPYQNVTFVTPPFPEFVSGHSTFSMAAAKTIAAFVGSDVYYDGESYGNYDLDHAGGIDLLGQYVATDLTFETWIGEDPVVLQWETLTEAAQEAGISRLYGGIHIMDGNLRGLEVGEKVAEAGQIRWDALFTRGGNDELVCDTNGGLVIAGAGRDHVRGRGGEDQIEGGSGNDKLYGGRGADMLMGEAGNDRLKGNADNDVLIGGDGNDQLIGNIGDDILVGGNERDRLSGGEGTDVFIFGPESSSYDAVKDFDAAEDIIALYGFGETAVVTFDQRERHVRLEVDGDLIARLRFADVTDLELGENVILGAEETLDDSIATWTDFLSL
ncbi:DUF6851 domain-containing protein [Sulfitobacter sp. THAF37]|uniref:DUF6851 domain-containing protein n=1 Tax=Sulfitobacter sp. THAF37 TaxID=2587855 RepID=UPI0020C74B6F|nr:phosphatase PAP2 family protein [Sulfitobacter sp. THAF37]